MPKIFLIKNRLHQQQLRLQEAESRKSEDKNRLNIPDQSSHHIQQDQEPLSLVARKRNNQEQDNINDSTSDNTRHNHEQGKRKFFLLALFMGEFRVFFVC